MLVGLFKALRRIITSAALNLFYLSRLDTSLTIKGWEFLDKGIVNPQNNFLLTSNIIAYASYTALLKVDATHNNPVMNAFICLLSHVAEVKAQSNARNELHSSCKHI